MAQQAIGFVETRGLIGLVEASDAMCKAANVELLKNVEIGGGYVTSIVRGDVASVHAAVTEHADRFGTVLALAAEVAFPEEGARVVRPQGTLPTLAMTERRVGLALRIGSWSGPLDRDHETTKLLADLRCNPNSLRIWASARVIAVGLRRDPDAPSSSPVESTPKK